jgi:putative drug exporter of the RND superfamily
MLVARALVTVRLLVVLAWAAAVWAAVTHLPAIGDERQEALTGIVPENAEAAAAEERQLDHFDVPLSARTVIVQRDPRGLSRQALAHSGRVASRATGEDEGLLGEVRLAVPVTNALGAFPGARERDTTIVTYLHLRDGVTLTGADAVAERYAEDLRREEDGLVGATGVAAAEHTTGNLIFDALPAVTIGASLLLVAIFAIAFRAVLAPLVVLGAAGVAYVVAVRVAGWASREVGVSAPNELRPVMVALVLGVVTDYAVFHMAGVRRRLEDGMDRRVAVARTLRDVGPIVLVAGLIVAFGVATLVVGRLDFFRALGPGLALTVLVTLLVGLTLVPALLAIAGRRMFWPWGIRDRPDGSSSDRAEPRAGLLARASTVRPGALPAALLCCVLLAAGATGLRHLDLGFTVIAALPGHAEPARAADAAAAGFAPGIVAPTVLMLEGSGVEDLRPRLERLEELLGGQPGVAGVLGPSRQSAGLDADVFLAAEAARYAIILDGDPHGGDGIARLDLLRDRLDGLLDRAGLPPLRASFSGDTALADETIERINADLVRVGIAALLVNLLLVALFLRAPVAALYLVAASLLSLAAALGLTVYVFQGLLGFSEITYFVPFAVAVLSLALGSDYNLFLAGRIWQEARRRRLREAILVVTPRARRTIALAGLTLAGSFAILALVPLRSFREFAFAMSIGVLVDTFLVRPLLVPSLIVLFGRLSWWPRRRVEPRPEAADAV